MGAFSLIVVINLLNRRKMKIKMLSRNPDDYMRETKFDVHKLPRNYNPVVHPFQAEREYTRALNATKLERVFAKPFITSLSGHTDGVYRMCKHPASLTTLISGSGDGEIIFWNLGSRQKLRMIQAHNGMVNGISCSQNGQVITTAGADSTLKHWKLYCADVDSFQQTNELNLKADENEEPLFMTTTKMPITCVHHQQTKANSGYFAAASGHLVEIWDVNRAQPMNTFKWDISQQHHVRFNPIEANLLSSLDSDHDILLYDIRKNHPIKKLQMRMSCNSLSWNPLEAYIFTVANEDYNLYTFDLRKMDTALYVHRDHVLAVMDVDYSPTGQEFVSAGFDKTIRIYENDKSRSREVYHTRRMQRLHCIQWSLDDRYIISGSDEMNLRLWKARASERLNILRHKQRNSAEYQDKLRSKYQHHPQIRRISKHRQVPKYVKFHSQQFRMINASQKRKEENRRLHSAPGTVMRTSAKKKNILNEN